MISGVCLEDIPFAPWVLMLEDMRLKTCVIFRDSKSDKDYFCGREKCLSRMALSEWRLSGDFYVDQKGYRSAIARKSALTKCHSCLSLAVLV